MYLYIFEDGEVVQALTAPKQEDLDCVAEGILQVITYDGGTFLEVDCDGEMFDVRNVTLNEDEDFHKP